ncbi:TKL family protein kinase [Trichomonas vaginalis G3]|uniref:TKL family protein kinase n=1 Tax=Trichomonas vaginalis (strain ATCC PRA-98 / G3) TaxID=412133 RepID=A2ECX2_TRIV3|nr:protein ubiquitination [Trichomonas vaginalis G3]EAY09517.1 TKL family protein kinase [Trichomonas vaginalis G3]KAI5512978.1 protein ubiquitination [Trichomonas vaginalis G3]|eukprot:XP_001321740.1 TKL family protein kinase [Trichomonas vaginalis G3]
MDNWGAKPEKKIKRGGNKKTIRVRGKKADYILVTEAEIRKENLKDIKKFLNVYYASIKNDPDPNKKLVATKINRNNVPIEIQQQFITEIEVCKTLNHSGVNKPYDYAIDNNLGGLFIIYESPIMDFLENYITTYTTSPITDCHMIKILIGIASAVAYLHSNGYVCGDLRLGTVFLKSKLEPVIINYNLPELYPCPIIPYETKKSEYSAPELENNYVITPKSDAYSFGVILSKISQKLNNIKGKFYQTMKQLFEMCTDFDPSKRPSFTLIEKMLVEGVEDIPYVPSPFQSYITDIIKSNPNGSISPHTPHEFSAFADQIMTSVDKYISPLKDILPTKIITKARRNIHLRCLLISLIARNTEMVSNWILTNYKRNKMQDIQEIMDAVMQTTIICYQKVDIYAKLTKNLFKLSLYSNKLGFIPTFVLHKIYATFVMHDPYPNYMPYVAYLSGLYKRKVFNIFEIIQMIEDLFEGAPTPIFAIPLYIWFHKDIDRNSPGTSQKMNDLITKSDVRQVFKSFISGESEVSKLSTIIMADDMTQFKNYILDHPEEFSSVINPTVFEVCPYAQDNITVPEYVLLYNAQKIYTFLRNTTKVYDGDDTKMMQMAIIGNHTLYLEQHELNTRSENVVEASVQFHNYAALIQGYNRGIKLRNAENLFSAVQFTNLIALLFILSANSVPPAKKHISSQEKEETKPKSTENPNPNPSQNSEPQKVSSQNSGPSQNSVPSQNSGPSQISEPPKTTRPTPQSPQRPNAQRPNPPNTQPSSPQQNSQIPKTNENQPQKVTQNSTEKTSEEKKKEEEEINMRIITINKEAARQATEIRDHFGETIFQAAVKTGDFLFLRLLLSIPNVKPFATDSWGQNAIHWACRLGCDSPNLWEESAVRYPWWFGSDESLITGENLVNLVDLFRKYQNPGSFAAKLLSTQENIEPYSSFKENERMLNELAIASSNLEIWKASKLTFERRFGSPHCLKLLLKFSTKHINDVDEQGMTALHYAAMNGGATVVKMLTNVFGVDVNVQDRKGRTPLHIAARNNDALCYAIILSCGKVRPEIVDNKNRTAYEVAVRKNSQDVLDVAEKMAEKQCRIA